MDYEPLIAPATPEGTYDKLRILNQSFSQPEIGKPARISYTLLWYSETLGDAPSYLEKRTVTRSYEISMPAFFANELALAAAGAITALAIKDAEEYKLIKRAEPK